MKEYENYWWYHLLAIPISKTSNGFRRIERLIRDKTRYGKFKSGRLHEFYNPRHETQLTASTWENFSIFQSYEWVNELLQYTELPCTEIIEQCNWSYEWESKVEGKTRLCDIVINFKTASTNEVIIVECKNLKKSLSEKDIDSEYYLNIDAFQKFDRKYLIYCVDESVRLETISLLDDNQSNIGIITWQELAGLQIKMVDQLEVSESIKVFIKASLHQQFQRKGILPNEPIVDYLIHEKSMEEYLENGIRSKDMQNRIWEIVD